MSLNRKFTLESPVWITNRFLFKGEGDFTIETIYSHNDTIVRDIAEIPELEVLETDSTLLQYWYGYYINEREQSSPNRTEINDIIRVSTENRVLSRYTSFLCLEPADTVPICEECFDESGLETPITEVAFSKTPFSFSVNGMNLNVLLTLPDSFTGNSLKLNIFNLRGQLVHTVTVNDISAGFNSVSLSLASTNIATGQYIAQIRGDGYDKNIRFAIQ